MSTEPSEPDRVERPSADGPDESGVDPVADAAPDGQPDAQPAAAGGGQDAAPVDGVVADGGGRAEALAVGHPVLLYTLARVSIFVVVAALLYLVGARGFLLFAAAILVSGLLSVVVLSRLRDAISVRLADRVERSRAERAKRVSEEDDLY